MKSAGSGGHVAHRSQVYVKAQIQQKGGLVQGVGPDGLQPSGSEEGLGERNFSARKAG